MYSRLKQDMRDAGISVSEGDDLVATDLQPARDFLFFRGINIGENFHLYEEAIGAVDPAAQEAARLAREEAAAQAEQERIAQEAAAEQERIAQEQAAAAEQAERERLAALEAAQAAAEQVVADTPAEAE